jgi:hypothetical protein
VEHFCYELTVAKFGFQTVHDLIHGTNDVVELENVQGNHQLMVKARVTAKSTHIADCNFRSIVDVAIVQTWARSKHF